MRMGISIRNWICICFDLQSMGSGIYKKIGDSFKRDPDRHLCNTSSKCLKTVKDGRNTAYCNVWVLYLFLNLVFIFHLLFIRLSLRWNHLSKKTSRKPVPVTTTWWKIISLVLQLVPFCLKIVHTPKSSADRESFLHVNFSHYHFTSSWLVLI